VREAYARSLTLKNGDKLVTLADARRVVRLVYLVFKSISFALGHRSEGDCQWGPPLEASAGGLRWRRPLFGKILLMFRRLAPVGQGVMPGGEMSTFFWLGILSAFAASGLLLALAAILMQRASGTEKPPSPRS
jgi:hypothetical protein